MHLRRALWLGTIGLRTHRGSKPLLSWAARPWEGCTQLVLGDVALQEKSGKPEAVPTTAARSGVGEQLHQLLPQRCFTPHQDPLRGFFSAEFALLSGQKADPGPAGC